MTLTHRSLTFTDWLVVLPVVCINVLTLMSYTTYPIMYQPLIDKYDSNRKSLGLSFSILCIMADVGGILCTPFIKYYGCRHVTLVAMLLKTIAYLASFWADSVVVFHLIFGVVGGVGLGVSRLAAMCIIQEVFTIHRDLMTRVASLGYYIGNAIGPLVAIQGLSWNGIRGTLIIMASLQAQGMVLSMLLPMNRREKAHSNFREILSSFWSELTDVSVLGEPRYLCLAVLRFTWSSSRYILIVHIVNAAHLVGVTAGKANRLPALSTITSLGFGILNVALVRWLSPFAGLLVGIISSTVGCFLVTCGNYQAMVAAMILLGSDEAMGFPTLCILLLDVVGEDRFARALSITDLFQIPAHLVSGPLAGWLADRTGSYRPSYFTSGTLGVLSLILGVLFRFVGDRKDYELLRGSDVSETETAESDLTISKVDDGTTETICDK